MKCTSEGPLSTACAMIEFTEPYDRGVLRGLTGVGDLG